VVLTTVGIIVGILAAGAALVGLGGTIQLVALGFGGLATAIAAVGSLLGALLSPIGLVLAGIGALAAYLIHTSDLGGQALDWLGAKFQALKSTAIRAFGGIGDALAAGDLGLAARILWLTLKMEWQRGVNALNQLWVEVKRFFVAVWTEAVYGAAEVAANAWAGLQTGWTETVDFLADAWALFTTGLTKTWNTAIGFIRKAWVRLKSLFDSDVDVDAEVSRINEEVAGKNAGADAERDRRIFERDQARRRRLGEIESGRTGTLDELERMRDAEHARHAQQFAAEVQDSEAALAAARREWQAALEEASRKQSEADAAAGEPQSSTDRLKELENKLAGAGAGLQQAVDKVSVSGTFNAMAVRGLGGGSHAERTAKATEETAKNTKRLLDEAHHGGLQFT
jgi:hypothetical protein